MKAEGNKRNLKQYRTQLMRDIRLSTQSETCQNDEHLIWKKLQTIARNLGIPLWPKSQ